MHDSWLALLSLGHFVDIGMCACILGVTRAGLMYVDGKPGFRCMFVSCIGLVVPVQNLEIQTVDILGTAGNNKYVVLFCWFFHQTIFSPLPVFILSPMATWGGLSGPLSPLRDCGAERWRGGESEWKREKRGERRRPLKYKAASKATRFAKRDEEKGGARDDGRDERWHSHPPGLSEMPR